MNCRTTSVFLINAVVLGLIAGEGVLASHVVLVDNFADADLSEYTQTLVLDQNPTSDISFASPAGTLELLKTTDTDAEQVLLLRDDYSLEVGETLRVDLVWGDAPRADIGIAVAASATPTPLVYDAMVGGTQSTREDYVAVYVQSDVGNIKSLGVDGIVAPSTMFGPTGVPVESRGEYTQLYIRRDSPTVFVTGFRQFGVDQQFATWTFDNPAVGSAIGFFGDARAATTFGQLDNLRIVPEPATWVCGLLGAVIVVARRLIG